MMKSEQNTLPRRHNNTNNTLPAYTTLQQTNLATSGLPVGNSINKKTKIENIKHSSTDHNNGVAHTLVYTSDVIEGTPYAEQNKTSTVMLG